MHRRMIGFQGILGLLTSIGLYGSLVGVDAGAAVGVGAANIGGSGTAREGDGLGQLANTIIGVGVGVNTASGVGVVDTHEVAGGRLPGRTDVSSTTSRGMINGPDLSTLTNCCAWARFMLPLLISKRPVI
jgi:hypothetical protein